MTTYASRLGSAAQYHATNFLRPSSSAVYGRYSLRECNRLSWKNHNLVSPHPRLTDVFSVPCPCRWTSWWHQAQRVM